MKIKNEMNTELLINEVDEVIVIKNDSEDEPYFDVKVICAEYGVDKKCFAETVVLDKEANNVKMYIGNHLVGTLVSDLGTNVEICRDSLIIEVN
jgi:hypothetical protein